MRQNPRLGAHIAIKRNQSVARFSADNGIAADAYKGRLPSK